MKYYASYVVREGKEVPVGVYRAEGYMFEYFGRDGEWHEKPALFKKIYDTEGEGENVQEITADEAEQIIEENRSQWVEDTDDDE